MMFYYFNGMQSFGMVKDTWSHLLVAANFWSNSVQVKLSSESPDNSYKIGLPRYPSPPPISITPLVVGEATNVLPNSDKGDSELEERAGPAGIRMLA